jgi:hypothetical protein
VARMPNLRREVDIRHSETVGAANDVREAAIFLDSPGGALRLRSRMLVPTATAPAAWRRWPQSAAPRRA